QGGGDRLPGAVALPAPEVGVDGLPGRQVVRQQAPGPAGAQEVADAVDDLADVDAAGATTRLGGGDHRRQHSPLGVGQVGRVSLAGHAGNATAFTPFVNTL